MGSFINHGIIRAAFCTAALVIAATSAEALTLEEALALAYQANPTLKADREGLRALDEDVAAARSGFRPTIVGEGNLTRSEIDVEGTGGVVGARLAQPIFRGFRTVNGVRAARANVAAGREALKQSENDLLLATVRAYAGVLRDREVLALNRALIDILGAQLTAEQKRLRVGERTRTDVSQAEARLAGARASTATAEQRLAQSAEEFRQLVGVEPDGLAPLPPPPSLPPTREQAIEIAIDNNPAVKRALFGERAARYLVQVAKGALLPTLDALASVSWRDEVVQILDRKVNQTLATAQAVLTVPLYQAGSEYAAVRRAKHVANLRALEVEEETRSVFARVTTAWDALRNAQATTAALQASIAANEAAVEGVRREAIGGSRTTLDVLDAERELRDARVSIAISRHDEYVAAHELLASLGRMTAQELRLPVNIYDPAQHYRRAANAVAGFNP